MKHKATIFLTFILTVVCSLFFFSCKEKKAEPVVFDLREASVAEGTTLLALMEERESEGALKFTMEDGMVTSINGTKNSTNQYWMLYISDGENSNGEWGTYTYEGETLRSAIYGAETLTVKNGEIYVWVYQKF